MILRLIWWSKEGINVFISSTIDSFAQAFDYLKQSKKAKQSQNKTYFEDEVFTRILKKPKRALSFAFSGYLNGLYSLVSSIAETQLSKNRTPRLALMALLFVLLIFSYLAYLCKIPAKMKNKVLMTIRLLEIIPPQIITDVPSIRNSLNNASI